ncbi:MAG: hypothetical protein A2252_00665 [Elusimicrobia bacterium RIFOXYA2_FULL_39_19]|nr:MAG: hypothetical protein A2252_00665 [Elusimicrobia bacterium RIFOXYA2_FULL_39_19]
MENFGIITENIHKTFHSGFFIKRHTQALRGISLSVKKGEIFGILGPNGAGKTTFLNILSTQLLQDKGKVFILGKELTSHANNELKNKLNMCSGNPNFPWSLNVQEILKFYAMLYGQSFKQSRETADKYIAMFELEKFRKTRYDELSTGSKQRLSLAKSLINNPEILFLDEPTIGLDPDIASKIRKIILNLHKEREITILITTHYMKEAEELCERIAFIKDGQIKALGTRDELLSLTNSKDLEGFFLELA